VADARDGGYDPTAHLPKNRVLTRETHEALMSFWVSVGYRVLTAEEIEGIVGAPYEPTISHAKCWRLWD